MAILNLADLEVNKVSTDLKDYSLMLTAPTGFGKSPFIAELYGDRALMLGFENSQKGIAGIHSITIDGYDTLRAYVSQLENPAIREKFDVIIIDTLFLFDYYCEQSVNDAYGKDLIGDCLKYNKGYKIVDKKFLSIIKKLQRMNYTMVYICHPVEQKVKLADGTEIVRYEPKVSDRIKNLLIPEIDIRLFGHFDQEGNKVLFTQSTPHFDARVRVGEMESIIPFNAQVLREEFAKGIDRRYDNKELLVNNLEKKNVVKTDTRDYKEVIAEIVSIGQTLEANGKGVEANTIVCKELGLDDDGKQRTLRDCDERMISALEVILLDLKNLL